MSVTVLLEVQSKLENLAELKSIFKKTLPDTRAYEGCQGVEVIENQDDSCNLVLIQRWDSRQHYEKYLGWRTETGAVKALGALLAEPPSVRYYVGIDALKDFQPLK